MWGDWIPVDVHVDSFAERNMPASREARTQILTWASVEKGKVVSGVGNRKTGEVRIVTREATEEELEVFGHNRVPVIIEERY